MLTILQQKKNLGDGFEILNKFAKILQRSSKVKCYVYRDMGLQATWV